MKLEGPHPWLSSEGYNSVIRAVAKIEPRIGIERDVLIVQKFATEGILFENGLSRTSSPQEIPDIDSVFNLHPFRDRQHRKKTPRNISILGMPRAGKDTFIERLNSLGNENIITTSEPYAHIKAWKKTMPQDPLTQEHLRLAGAFGEFIVSEIEKRKRGIENTAITIHNRGLMDHAIFTAARLMYGEIPLQDYFDKEQGWIFRASMDMDAAIVFMQTPETSMERTTFEERKGNHMNKEFLTLLYEQYLEVILDLRRRKQPNLAVINTSGGIEENFNKLRSTLSAICGEKI